MAIQIIKPQDRNEWLKYRESGIGSSEVATILGLNRWETPLQLWRRKKKIDAPKQENEAMLMGHLLEDAVAQRWQIETGREIIKSSEGDWLIVNPDKPYMRVSPDRTYWLGNSRGQKDKGILECKTTRMEVDPFDIPKYWFVQVQYQLGVAELNEGALAWLVNGRDFGFKDIAFVPDFFQYISEEVERFWVDCIKGDKEPDPMSCADVMLKYPIHTAGKVVEIGENYLNTYTEIKELKDRISELEEKKTDLENELKSLFGDAEAIAYKGQTLATWKAPKESSKFDTAAFQKDHPDMAKDYLKPFQGGRRFLLK